MMSIKKSSEVPCNALAVALKGVGFKPLPIAANDTNPIDRILVELVSSQFTVAFHCFKKDIPRGVQILPASGERKKHKPKTISRVKLDLSDMLERMTVDSISVINNSGFCVVYLNCTVGINHDGLGHWGRKHGNVVYDNLISDLARCTWANFGLNRSEGKTTLTLRNYSNEEHDSVIRFAIKQ